MPIRPSYAPPRLLTYKIVTAMEGVRAPESPLDPEIGIEHDVRTASVSAVISLNVESGLHTRFPGVPNLLGHGSTALSL